MKVAICGYPPLAFQIIEQLKNFNIECTHFVKDFISSHGEQNFQITPPIKEQGFFLNFFEFRKLINSKEIEGLIIVEHPKNSFLTQTVKICKFYGIPNVGVVNFENPFTALHWLDTEKFYMNQLEANVIDSCNLNCKSCTHYSNLFSDSDFYPLDEYARDLRQVSSCVEVEDFYILGGEPFKVKNLDEYLKITRKFLPNTNLRLVTNGLLVPNVSQHIFDSLRENKFVVDISMYPPTVRMIDKITEVFKKNNIPCNTRGHVHFFNAFLTLHGGHDPLKARQVCADDSCRFMRNGKIYKCPVDALSFKFVERFGLKGFPAPTSVDIFAKNFTSLIEQLDGNIELCTWCNESVRRVDWKPENNPEITDWLANPDEIKNFLPK